MREADSSLDGPLRHSRSRSKRAPCHHLIRPFYWFHNHLCMLWDMSKMHIWHVQPQESNTDGNDQSHLSSLFYKTHLSETFRMFFQCSLTFTACALFIWTPWIAQKNKCAWLEMHLGQVVFLLHLSVLSPFYHHVEMAEGGQPEIAHYFSPFSLFRTCCTFCKREELLYTDIMQEREHVMFSPTYEVF